MMVTILAGEGTYLIRSMLYRGCDKIVPEWAKLKPQDDDDDDDNDHKDGDARVWKIYEMGQGSHVKP